MVYMIASHYIAHMCISVCIHIHHIVYMIASHYIAHMCTSVCDAYVSYMLICVHSMQRGFIMCL